MGLKDIYHSLEEKYYGLVDRLDQFVPVSGLVDRIDKVVPSFLFFVGLFVLLVLLAGFFLFGGIAPQATTLTIEVVDNAQSPLENATVSITSLDAVMQEEKKTNAQGKIVLENVQIGTQIDLIVEKRNFDRKTASIEVDVPDKVVRIVLSGQVEQPTPHFVVFANPQGIKLSGTEINAHFECTNSEVSLAQKDFTITTGEVSLTPPIGCGFLTVRANADGFLELREVLDLPGKTFRFSSPPTPKGNARIIVKDSDSGAALENIKVSVFDEEGGSADSPTYTKKGGEVSFSLAPGEYEASVEDVSGNYGQKDVSFAVAQEQTVTETVELDKKLAATLRISVKDKDTGQRIDGAKVVVKKGSKVVGERTISSDNKEAVFALSEKGNYSYVASHEDYLSGTEKTVDLSNVAAESEVDVVFELEKCKPEVCGVLKVRVVDEKNSPVENAKVFLFDTDTNTIALEFGEKTTDSNGYVTPYQNIGKKRVYAYAQKYPASGKSTSITIDPLVENSLEVRLFIGDGKISVEAASDSGAAVPFGLVDVFASNSQLVGTFTLDEQGKGTLSTKADKEVFVRVKKDGFLPYYSVQKPVVKNGEIKVKAVLSQSQPAGALKAVFLGLFDESGNLVSQTISAGENYVARFSVHVPSGKNYSTAGMHVRTGPTAHFDSDKIYIQKVNAPLASVSGSRTFNPPISSQTDKQNPAGTDIKWADIVWANVQPATYSVEVELRVRPETVPGAQLPLFFRSFGTAQNGVERDPLDPVLGTNADTGSKHGLYAEAYRQVFFEGAEKICDESFCFAQRVVDIKEGLVLREPYKLRVFDDYNFFFSVTNNSGTLHDNADLRIKNTSDGFAADNKLSIDSYSITNADLVKFTSTEPLFELEHPLSLGFFSPFKSVEGEMRLQPKEIASSGVQMVIVSGVPQGQEVFSKTIQFEALALDKVKLSVDPEQLIAFKPITLEISAEYENGAKEGKPLENGIIVVKKIDAEEFETSQEVVTDEQGKAIVELCTGTGCSPGTKVVIEVQSPGIQSTPLELEITDAVVEFEPKSLEFNLNITSVTSETKTLEMKNLIPEAVKISRIILRGSFDGLLDTEKMSAFLAQYAGTTNIEFEETRDVRVLAELNDNARLLEEVSTSKGSILFDIQNLDGTTTWPMREVPVTVTVDLAQPPKDPNCIIISSAEWTDSVLETSAIKEFSIVNNCVTEDGSPMDLKNLQATIIWSSDEVGQVVFSVFNPATGETSTQVLQGGLATIVLESMPYRQELLGTLQFVPKPSRIGEAAVFAVKFNAELLTATGQSLVNADKDIQANLLIINLSGCIKTTPSFNQVLDLKEDTGVFTISTAECGDIPIDLRFCHNDSGCAGGASEGSIGVSPTSFSDLRAEEMEVQVSRETIPGIYGVTIEARPRGGGWRHVGEVLVLVEPKEGYAFKLSKYDFIIIGDGAKDSATLTNTLLSEEVQVDASDCDWGTAKEKDKSMFNMAGAGVGAAAGALLGAQPAIQAAQQASQAAAASRIGTNLPATKSLDDAVTKSQEALDNLTKAQEEFINKSAKALQGPIKEAIGRCETLSGTPIPFGDLDSAVEATKTGMQNAVDKCTQCVNKGITTQANVLNTKASYFGPGNNISSNFDKAAADLTSYGGTGSLGDMGNLAARAISAIGEALTGVATQGTAVEATSTQIKGIIAEVATNPDYPPLEKEEIIEACTQAITALKTYNMENIKHMQDALNTGKGLVENAKGAIGKAAEFMDKAAQNISKLAEETKPAEDTQNGKAPGDKPLDTFNEGRFIMVEGFYAGLGALAGGLLPGLLGGDEDPCDERTQFNVVDWVINLKNDAREVGLDKEGVGASWSTDDARTFGEFAKQEVGVVFTNTGADDPLPSYGVATFSAIRHVHENPTIIERGNSDFGQFNVPDQSTEEYNEKFHLRFKTSETEEPLPDLGSGAQSCVSGVNIGRTGEGSIPRIRFDWNWKNFSMNSCDAGNVDAIYCDAAQFNMELGYRLDALKEFLDKNREKLLCPENPADDLAARLAGDIPQQIYSGELPSSALEGKVALVTHTFSATEDSLTVSVVVGNSSGESQDATARVEITPPEGVTAGQTSCEIIFSGIEPNGTKTNSCTFRDLPQSAEDYAVTVTLVGASTDFEEKTLGFSTQIKPGINCWMPPSTDLYDGRPAIDYYVEKVEPSISWTARIPDRQALNDLFVFDVLLIRDGYSADFLDDFVEYSNEVNFFDTPTFFNKLGSGVNGDYGFDEYYSNGNISFEKKYSEGDSGLSRGGVYRVETVIDFGGFFQLFDQQGRPFSNVKVKLQLVNEPEENHVFYHLPFDGLVGLQGNNSFDRKGYGLGFVNKDPQKLVSLNSEEGGFQTFESSSSSNALVNTDVEFVESFFELNSNPVSRGSLLSIENTGTGASVRFAPSLATPVMMRMKSEQREDSFGAYYSLLENGSKANVGSVLNFWTGAGQCLDFSGQHIKEAFDDKPDRLATEEDRFVNWQNTYTQQWPDALKEGSVYLYAIFYSSPFNTTELKADGPLESLEFFSPDEGPAKVVALKGISSMPFNSAGSHVGSIQQVFELVKQGVLCETSTGNRVSYWWNPKNVLEAEGSAECINCEGKRSVVKEDAALTAGNACIGAN